jgi:hypothetical protein
VKRRQRCHRSRLGPAVGPQPTRVTGSLIAEESRLGVAHRLKNLSVGIERRAEGTGQEPSPVQMGSGQITAFASADSAAGKHCSGGLTRPAPT